MNGTRLDDRIIRTDWDAGFVEGRQYGRGKTGGQVRDEYCRTVVSSSPVIVIPIILLSIVDSIVCYPLV